jgi:hypothetical protein
MARSVPLSRFTPRVGGGSAFFVRHQDRSKILQSWLVWRRFEQFDSDEQVIDSSFGFSSRRFMRRASAEPQMCERWDLPDIIMNFTSLMPNKTLEPTADGVVRSAIAVHATSRRWLSFFR